MGYVTHYHRIFLFAPFTQLPDIILPDRTTLAGWVTPEGRERRDNHHSLLFTGEDNSSEQTQAITRLRIGGGLAAAYDSQADALTEET